jgi:hypothetical protein
MAWRIFEARRVLVANRGLEARGMLEARRWLQVSARGEVRTGLKGRKCGRRAGGEARRGRVR